MDPLIEKEIMQNHNQADAFISLFFAGLDAVCYIIILTLFGCEFKGICSPKQKLSLLIILDAILRIINMYTDEYSKHWFKEIFLSSFVTSQFYIIVSCLNDIFTDKGNEAGLENDLEIKNLNLITTLFFPLVFSFKGLLFFYKLLSALQYICIEHRRLAQLAPESAGALGGVGAREGVNLQRHPGAKPFRVGVLHHVVAQQISLLDFIVVARHRHTRQHVLPLGDVPIN